MAPHKTPRKKKQQQNVSTPNGHGTFGPGSPLEEDLPAHSETYEKAQEDEREVLKAIFMDDYEESEAKGAWSVCTRIFVM